MLSKISVDAQSFWNVKHEAIADLSHWRGIGRWVNEQNWVKIGTDNFTRFKQLCRLVERNEIDIETMLEWGVGGGANAIAFCRIAEIFYGVDISHNSLLECQKQLSLLGYNNFRPIEIEIDRPCLTKIEPVDFIISTSCFQHFPSKEYGINIVQIISSLLKNNGLSIIQIRFDDGSEKYAPRKEDYFRNAVVFTSYKIDEFWKALIENGLVPIAIQLDSACYAYYFCSKII